MIDVNKEIEKLFHIADKNLKCNTAYPIFKDSFQKYISNNDIFKNTHELSFYIHIPFCAYLCKFCEYTKFLAGDAQTEETYLRLLEKQVNEFVNTHKITKIYGFDIGGGTPTSLSNKNFEKLLEIHKNLEDKYEKVEDYEKSIEISFSTINDEKLSLLKQYDFHRVSAGMQTISRTLLDENNRVPSQIKDILVLKEKLDTLGIEKLNIDLMYGMTNQTKEMISDTLDAISIISPKQVTLYETRFNRNNMDYSKISRDVQYLQYCYMYERLIDMGYSGYFGQNTFVKDPQNDEDIGVSSYLKYRMRECIPYKGFGISAQSMSLNGISYGMLKNTTETNMPNIHKIKNGHNYILPKEEIAAKYVCIALYSGRFRLDTLHKILGNNPLDIFKNEFDFLVKNKLVNICYKEVILTPNGFRHYGAIGTLFWSKQQKEQLLQNKGE